MIWLHMAHMQAAIAPLQKQLLSARKNLQRWAREAAEHRRVAGLVWELLNGVKVALLLYYDSTCYIVKRLNVKLS